MYDQRQSYGVTSGGGIFYDPPPSRNRALLHIQEKKFPFLCFMASQGREKERVLTKGVGEKRSVGREHHSFPSTSLPLLLFLPASLPHVPQRREWKERAAKRTFLLLLSSLSPALCDSSNRLLAPHFHPKYLLLFSHAPSFFFLTSSSSFIPRALSLFVFS